MSRGRGDEFEDLSEITVDGLAGPSVWRALLDYVINGKRLASRYCYVFVHREVPRR